MKQNDWNPDLYLKFGKERIQPTIDLVNRINFKNPQKIIDIGCGPGNSTQILFQRWPEAEITGIDNSPTMIEKAKTDYPNLNWELIDAGKDKINGQYDIVFSNATIQWVPDHENLLKKLANSLTTNGLIAIQIPLFWEMPLGKSIAKIAETHRWANKTKGVTNLFTIYDHHFYYDHLSQMFTTIEIWESQYLHIMESYQAVLEMISSTGLRPYLDKLESEKDKEEFTRMVLESIVNDYPWQDDGKVIFPFKRLFFIASNN